MRAVGFVAVPILGHFLQLNSADSPHVEAFRAALVLAVSGGPDLDFPQYDSDTLVPLADFAADFNILRFLSICRDSAAPLDTNCNCSVRMPRCQTSDDILPAVKDVVSPRRRAGDLPIRRIQLLGNLSRSRP